MIKSFKQWAEDQNFELPVLTDAPEGEESTKENRARTGWSANYPDGYYASQYPHKYVNPKKATTDLDAEQMKKS